MFPGPNLAASLAQTKTKTKTQTQTPRQRQNSPHRSLEILKLVPSRRLRLTKTSGRNQPGQKPSRCFACNVLILANWRLISAALRYEFESGAPSELVARSSSRCSGPRVATLQRVAPTRPTHETQTGPSLPLAHSQQWQGSTASCVSWGQLVKHMLLLWPTNWAGWRPTRLKVRHGQRAYWHHRNSANESRKQQRQQNERIEFWRINSVALAWPSCMGRLIRGSSNGNSSHFSPQTRAPALSPIAPAPPSALSLSPLAAPLSSRFARSAGRVFQSSRCARQRRPKSRMRRPNSSAVAVVGLCGRAPRRLCAARTGCDTRSKTRGESLSGSCRLWWCASNICPRERRTLAPGAQVGA